MDQDCSLFCLSAPPESFTSIEEFYAATVKAIFPNDELDFTTFLLEATERPISTNEAIATLKHGARSCDGYISTKLALSYLEQAIETQCIMLGEDDGDFFSLLIHSKNTLFHFVLI